MLPAAPPGLVYPHSNPSPYPNPDPNPNPSPNPNPNPNQVKHTLRASDAHTLDAIISRLLALLLLQQQPAHTVRGRVGVGAVLGLGLADPRPRPRPHPHPHPHAIQLTSAPDAADPTATTASVGAAVVESAPGGASEDGSGATAAAQGPQLSSLP